MKLAMKLKPLILFVFIQSFLFAQQKTTLFFDANWNAPKSAASRVFYCECFMFENKVLHGPFTCYNQETGDLVKRYHFEENRLHGDIEEFYPDGSVKLKATYNKGLPIDEWMEWTEDGTLVTHKTFDENSRIKKDYFTEKEFDYKIAMGKSFKKEELPIYGSECLLKKLEKERYNCSDEAMFEYYHNPPKPPSYIDRGGQFVTKLKYLLTDKGRVDEVEIIESSGDTYLDELASIHVLNMIPFESAKEYGMPINYWIKAEIVFNFE
jgi:hypothetical protein